MTDPSVRKRSVTLNGHPTSISLEDAFWEAIRVLAKDEGETPTRLIARIDATRGASSLSSALRVYALARYREKAEGT